MGLLTFIVLVIAMGFGTVKLNRVLRLRRQAEQALPTTGENKGENEAGTPVTQPSGPQQWLATTITKLQGKPVVDNSALEFRRWVASALNPEAPLQAWLLSLSPQQMEVLVTHIIAYCEQLTVKLSWLTAGELDIAPALKHSTQEIVITYCTSIWKATQIKEKLNLFNEYQQLTKPALQQQQQVLQRELLARLGTQQLVPAERLADTLVGTVAERQAKVVIAIQQAATADWERFSTILQNKTSQNGSH